MRQHNVHYHSIRVPPICSTIPNETCKVHNVKATQIKLECQDLSVRNGLNVPWMSVRPNASFQNLPSGYLKDSAPPKITDICHVDQLSNTQKTFDINQIDPQGSVAEVKAFSASTPN